MSKGVNSQHMDANLNDSVKLLLQLFCNSTLCIMRIFFQIIDLYKYKKSGTKNHWVWSWIVLCIFSADLFLTVLDVHIKSGAEL